MKADLRYACLQSSGIRFSVTKCGEHGETQTDGESPVADEEEKKLLSEKKGFNIIVYFSVPGNEKVGLHYWKWRRLICGDDNGL